MALHPCPACARHVRHDASRCPFCDALLGSMSDEVPPVRFVSRAALLLGAALAASSTGCQPSGERPTPPTTPALPSPERPTSASADAPRDAMGADATGLSPDELIRTLLGTTAADGGSEDARVQGTRAQPSSLGLEHAAAAGGYGGPPVLGTIGVSNRPATVRRENGPARGDRDPAPTATRYGAPPFHDDLA